MRYYEDIALYLKVLICYNFTYLKISSLSAQKEIELYREYLIYLLSFIQIESQLIAFQIHTEKALAASSASDERKRGILSLTRRTPIVSRVALSHGHSVCV